METRTRRGAMKANRQQATERNQLLDRLSAQYSFQIGSLNRVHIIIKSIQITQATLYLSLLFMHWTFFLILSQLYNLITMNPNLQKLIASESSYEKNITEILQLIKKDPSPEGIFRKIILFCKYAFSVNYAQHKKYLCLMLIKDISEHFKSPEFEKLLDENIPIKLLKCLSQELMNINRQSRHQDDEREYSDKVIRFAAQTISFWAKKLSFLPGKSHFAEAYEDLKKMKLDLPKGYEYYKSQKLALGLWGDRDDSQEQFVKNQEVSPLISELTSKFNDCKTHIQERINEAVLNEQQIYLKSITQKLRDFLMIFYSKYKNLEVEVSIDRDVLVVYYHIINSLFKRICSRFYVPVQEIISITKECFQGNHSSDFSSIDRMDIVNLAGIHKYNALSIFQRVIHNRIEQQEERLGPCELSFEQRQSMINPSEGLSRQVHNRSKADLMGDDKRAPKFKR